jgi:DNA-binding MarR family transcriptional regulator
MARTRDAAAALAELTLESFRLNSLLLAAGDRLARPEGLTSAGWQVLGTLVLAREPLTVAAVARRMGLARQSVQRVADALAGRGLVAYRPNPDHQRWQLVAPTRTGRALHQRLEARRRAWAGRLTAGAELAELRAAGELIRRIRARITAGAAGDPAAPGR